MSTMYHFSEPLVESIPQFFIMIYIIINNRNGDTISFDNFFWSSFASSVFSSAFVLTKQLKVGPCQLMPKDKFGLTFMLIFFGNIFGLLGKGCLLNVWGSYMKLRGYGVSYGPIMMIITSILPPIIFVSKLLINYFASLYFHNKLQKMLSSFKFQQFINLGINQGFKKALTTVRDYPSILLLPAFSIWTYGSIEKGSHKNCQSSQKIGLSFLNSSINACYTLLVAFATTIIFLSGLGFEDLGTYLELENLTFSFKHANVLSLFSMIPFIVVSIILMSVVTCMDTCSCCSCSCCCNFLLPMTERTENNFSLQEKATTKIALVETTMLANPNDKTTAPTPTSDATTVEMQQEATETK